MSPQNPKPGERMTLIEAMKRGLSAPPEPPKTETEYERELKTLRDYVRTEKANNRLKLGIIACLIMVGLLEIFLYILTPHCAP